MLSCRRAIAPKVALMHRTLQEDLVPLTIIRQIGKQGIALPALRPWLPLHIHCGQPINDGSHIIGRQALDLHEILRVRDGQKPARHRYLAEPADVARLTMHREGELDRLFAGRPELHLLRIQPCPPNNLVIENLKPVSIDELAEEHLNVIALATAPGNIDTIPGYPQVRQRINDLADRIDPAAVHIEAHELGRMTAGINTDSEPVIEMTHQSALPEQHRIPVLVLGHKDTAFGAGLGWRGRYDEHLTVGHVKLRKTIRQLEYSGHKHLQKEYQ